MENVPDGDNQMNGEITKFVDENGNEVPKGQLEFEKMLYTTSFYEHYFNAYSQGKTWYTHISHLSFSLLFAIVISNSTWKASD